MCHEYQSDDDALEVKAADIGLCIHPQAKIHCLPHLGAYVGADLVGGLMATGLAQAEGVRLLVDVGTNGEIVLGSAARTVATAAPAGPAFEGAQIQSGMRASDGAIEAVTITPDVVQLQVIGDVPPVGLCGSGLLDDAGRRAFVLAWEHESGNGRLIALTQRGIRELQFAKAAIASGIETMMTELGVTRDDLEEIYLAGSFGNYINPQSARIIGLVPPIPVERIKAVDNASGEGAKMALLSFRERQIAHSLPQIIEYHELSSRGDFNDAFISILQFSELVNL
ncbi:MAG: ATP-binding protein [Chloroflexi bacterium]|nr:ATP-binding protein [Chloroflexota bacterium]